MRNARDVFLTIGKESYTINTPLENDTLDRVKAIINEACGEVVKGARQEDLLMVTCLRLAYSLDSVNGKLRKILERIDGEE